jgi:hypothetical protein
MLNMFQLRKTMYDHTDAKKCQTETFQMNLVFFNQQTSVSIARSCPRNILCTSLPNKITNTNA